MINRPNNNVNLSDVAEAVQINNLHQRLERMNMTRVNTLDSDEQSPVAMRDRTFEFNSNFPNSDGT